MAESANSAAVVPVEGMDPLAATLDGVEQPTPPLGHIVTQTTHRIGRFVILRQLGQGGMGIVYAAYDEELDRKVALKLLHGTEMENSDRRARILREAQALARVSHPNVVHVYEVGEVSGQVFIAMEFVDGCTLHTWQRQRERTWEDVLGMYLAAGQGLLAAHKVGLVHRDFKPDNVLVGVDGRPRVADFGLARAQGGAEPPTDPSPPDPSPTDSSPASPSPSSSKGLLASPLTAFGALVGTPAYMSPEQYRGEIVDSRGDQFGFCAALYEALYQQLPFEGSDLAELSGNILIGKVRPAPKNTPVPPVIEQVLRRGLALLAAQRFPSMAELLTALLIDPRNDPAGAPRLQRTMTGVLLSVVALIILHITTSKRQTVTLPQMVGVSVFMLLGVLVTAWVMRRELQRNSFHRGMIKLLIALGAQMVVMRLAALIGGLSVSQTIAMDMMALAGISALMCWDYLPRVWPMPFCAAIVGIVAARFPETALALGNVFLPGCAIVFFLAWKSAVRRLPR